MHNTHDSYSLTEWGGEEKSGHTFLKCLLRNAFCDLLWCSHSNTCWDCRWPKLPANVVCMYRRKNPVWHSKLKGWKIRNSTGKDSLTRPEETLAVALAATGSSHFGASGALRSAGFRTGLQIKDVRCRKRCRARCREVPLPIFPKTSLGFEQSGSSVKERRYCWR